MHHWWNCVTTAATGQRHGVHNAAGRIKLKVQHPVVRRIQYAESIRCRIHIHIRIRRAVDHGRILIGFHGL